MKINFPFRDVQTSPVHVWSAHVSQKAMVMIVSIQLVCFDDMWQYVKDREHDSNTNVILFLN